MKCPECGCKMGDNRMARFFEKYMQLSERCYSLERADMERRVDRLNCDKKQLQDAHDSLEAQLENIKKTSSDTLAVENLLLKESLKQRIKSGDSIPEELRKKDEYYREYIIATRKSFEKEIADLNDEIKELKKNIKE